MGEELTIGAVAERSGLRRSAIRYYEDIGLIASVRTEGNQRRYRRDVLRRLGFVQAAQRVGLSLDEVRSAFATLPPDARLTAEDWKRLSRSWRDQLDERIHALEVMRDQVTSCIGCGCLSMQRCRLVNPDDTSGSGAGPRLLFPAGPPRSRPIPSDEGG